MTSALTTIHTLLAEGQGILLGRHHPGLERTIQRMAAEGELTAVLPGTYCAAGDDRLDTLLRAVTAHDPHAVVARAAAARLTFWPELAVERIHVANPYDLSALAHQAPRIRVERPVVPRSLTRTSAGIRHSAPALTALDLCETHGAEVIHRVLRSRTATVRSLHAAFALTAGRRGNVELGIRSGLFLQRYLLDIAFPAVRLAVEVEGHAHHSTPADLNRDRYRHNDLTAAGWTVVRVDLRMLTTDPAYVVRLVADAISALGAP